MNTADCFATIESRFADWHYDHPKVLYGLIRSLRPQIVVEVGAYRGYAACYMARAIQENNAGRLYCIDDFSESIRAMPAGDPVAHWEENLRAAGVRDWVTLLIGKSTEATWPKRVDFAYIDGWHGYVAVAADFEACACRGAEVIALDDTQSTVGPRQFLADLRKNPLWDVAELHRDNGLGLCFRRKPNRPIEFSQEDPSNPGFVLRGLTDEAKRTKLEEWERITRIRYGDVLP